MWDYRSEHDKNSVLKGLHSSGGVEQTVKKWNLCWIAILALVKSKAAKDIGGGRGEGGGVLFKTGREGRILAVIWDKYVLSRENRKFRPSPEPAASALPAGLHRLPSVPRSAWPATHTPVSKTEATLQPSHLGFMLMWHPWEALHNGSVRASGSAKYPGPVGSLSEQGGRADTVA